MITTQLVEVFLCYEVTRLDQRSQMFVDDNIPNFEALLRNKVFPFNPIRSGLFQTANDRGGGGSLKAPPPYDLENYCVNLHHIIHVNFTRCFRHDPIENFSKIRDFDHYTAISK